jgi:16S rRNA (guanine966-N2)-methyltransferase
MRIVGGRLRGRPLVAPDGRDAVRPTAERTREAVFNILLHRFQGQGITFYGARVLDAFAGTGAMGLEALSRGAGPVTFLELDPAALRALQANVAAMAGDGEAAVLRGDACQPPPPPGRHTLAFLDPPYDRALLRPALTALSAAGWLAAGALCVCEHRFSDDLAPPEGFEVLDERRYGKAKVTILRYHAADASPAP